MIEKNALKKTQLRFYQDPAYYFMLSLSLPFLVWLNPTATAQPVVHFYAFITLVIFYPVAEEFIFRGTVQVWLQKHLMQCWGPLTAANIATSVLFSAAHLLYHPPFWALATFFPSLIFGYSLERYKNLSAPIVLHSTYNCGYFFWGG
jgi:membrane protease YdiL (CAAX protease family)